MVGHGSQIYTGGLLYALPHKVVMDQENMIRASHVTFFRLGYGKVMNPAFQCDPTIFEGSSYNGHKLQKDFKAWQKDFKTDFSIRFNLRNTCDVDYIAHYNIKGTALELFHHKNAKCSVLDLARQKQDRVIPEQTYDMTVVLVQFGSVETEPER